MASTHETETDEQVFRGYTGRLSTIVSLGWLTILLGREAIPPLLPSIITDISITSAGAGIGLTIMWAIYSLLHYPAGKLSDSLSRTLLLQASFLLTSVGFLLILAVSSFPGFLLAVSCLGFGAGLYFTPARSLVSDLFIEKRGQVLGIHGAAGMIGSALAAGLSILALSLGHWKLAFLPVAPLLVLELLLLTKWSKESVGTLDVTFDLGGTLARVFRTRHVRWVLVAYALYAFTWQAFLTFFPTFLQFEKLLSAEMAGVLYGLLFVIGGVIGPIAGSIADRFSRISVAIGTLLLSLVGTIGLLLGDSLAGLVAFTIVAAVGLRSYPPTMQAYLFDQFSADRAGGDFGVIKSVYTGLGSLGPAYMGVAAEEVGYTGGFWGLTLALLASGCILFYSRRV